ncbi:hypothetical protein ZWY2020_006859 [Hordeum vulgare]|nr:hypothetical protein ZWY2020_006859 [Hordeum vulgare]
MKLRVRSDGGGEGGGTQPPRHHVVPLDAAVGITRSPRSSAISTSAPETIALPASRRPLDPVIPWYHANWMLSFYAPVRDASGNVHTSEERDDAHDSFLQVKKGYVLLTRMESITTYKNQHGQQRSGKNFMAFKLSHVKRLKTKRMKLKVHFQMSKDTIFSRPHTKALCTASHRSLVEKARATAAFQQRNSELSHQITNLQDQLQAERATTQEIINLERAEREQLEEKLKEERAERERLLEAERTSRLKFEKNVMAKFAEFSKQMGTQQE